MHTAMPDRRGPPTRAGARSIWPRGRRAPRSPAADDSALVLYPRRKSVGSGGRREELATINALRPDHAGREILTGKSVLFVRPGATHWAGKGSGARPHFTGNSRESFNGSLERYECVKKIVCEVLIHAIIRNGGVARVAKRVPASHTIYPGKGCSSPQLGPRPS